MVVTWLRHYTRYQFSASFDRSNTLHDASGKALALLAGLGLYPRDQPVQLNARSPHPIDELHLILKVFVGHMQAIVVLDQHLRSGLRRSIHGMQTSVQWTPPQVTIACRFDFARLEREDWRYVCVLVARVVLHVVERHVDTLVESHVRGHVRMGEHPIFVRLSLCPLARSRVFVVL